MSTDAIVMLRQDHKEVKRLFRRFEKADQAAEKQSLVKQILEMLAVHTYIENEGMYPRVRKLVPDLESDILESYEEHHVADLLCAELAEMTPDDERFTAKVTVLIESVEHHIEEEESNWFPDVREALGRKDLQEIGAQMLKLRRRAPRQPKQAKVELAQPSPARSSPAKSSSAKSSPAKSSPAKSSAAKASPAKSSPAKSSAAKSSAAKSSAAKSSAADSNGSKSNGSRTSAVKASAAKPTMPAQADASNRPPMTPPPLPGAEGSIELMDASMPGARTQAP
ncbi:MAG TPA: hemerythrin domain-containing protein [Sporichthya sp.]|nr:hemerythrin domain-containing protein [Sporichthya sp.]